MFLFFLFQWAGWQSKDRISHLTWPHRRPANGSRAASPRDWRFVVPKCASNSLSTADLALQSFSCRHPPLLNLPLFRSVCCEKQSPPSPLSRPSFLVCCIRGCPCLLCTTPLFLFSASSSLIILSLSHSSSNLNLEHVTQLPLQHPFRLLHFATRNCSIQLDKLSTRPFHRTPSSHNTICGNTSVVHRTKFSTNSLSHGMTVYSNDLMLLPRWIHTIYPPNLICRFWLPQMLRSACQGSSWNSLLSC